MYSADKKQTNKTLAPGNYKGTKNLTHLCRRSRCRLGEYGSEPTKVALKHLSSPAVTSSLSFTTLSASFFRPSLPPTVLGCSYIPSLVRSFLHSSFLPSFIHSSFLHSVIPSFLHSFILLSFLHSSILPSSIPSFLHSFIPLFLYSLIP